MIWSAQKFPLSALPTRNFLVAISMFHCRARIKGLSVLALRCSEAFHFSLITGVNNRTIVITVLKVNPFICNAFICFVFNLQVALENEKKLNKLTEERVEQIARLAVGKVQGQDYWKKESSNCYVDQDVFKPEGAPQTLRRARGMLCLFPSLDRVRRPCRQC